MRNFIFYFSIVLAVGLSFSSCTEKQNGEEELEFLSKTRDCCVTCSATITVDATPNQAFWELEVYEACPGGIFDDAVLIASISTPPFPNPPIFVLNLPLVYDEHTYWFAAQTSDFNPLNIRITDAAGTNTLSIPDTGERRRDLQCDDISSFDCYYEGIRKCCIASEF